MRNHNKVNERIKYLDIAKFIGIFCIYLGHFGSQAGYAYKFVFCFHVPLFFFLSGCSENFSKDINLKKYIIKNLKKIILPFFIFSILSVIFNCIYSNSINGLTNSLLIILKGCIRNTFFAGSLWFLTCLFIIKIMFYIFRKIIKNKYLIILTCLLLYVFTGFIINTSPLVNPRMFFNIDSAFYYIIYYALGYYSLNIIHSILSWDCKFKINFSIILGLLSSIYTFMLFFDKNIFNFLNSIKYLCFLPDLLCPIVVIILIILISKLLENNDFFSNIGENTLYLCGSEYFIKLLIPICLEIFGLSLYLSNPIATYIYTFILLIVCNRYLVPLEKQLFKRLHII